MPYRPVSAPLSAFDPETQTLDEFRIKRPFTGNPNDVDSLEVAGDWNHMFDAAERIRKHLIRSAGAPITTGQSFGSSLEDANGVFMGRQTVELSFSNSGSYPYVSDVFEVPAEFGENPFLDPRFALSHTFFPETNGTVSGIWKDRPAGSTGVSNALLTWDQYRVAIAPENADGTGREFRIYVNRLSPLRGAGVLRADTCSRTDAYKLNRLETSMGDRDTWDCGPVWAPTYTRGSSAFRIVKTEIGNQSEAWYLMVATEQSNGPQGGIALPDSAGHPTDVAAFASATDQEFQFRLGGYSYINVEGGERANSVGFFIRGNGNVAAFDGYGVLIGDANRNQYDDGFYGAWTAKLVKFVDYDFESIDTGSPIDGTSMIDIGTVSVQLGGGLYRVVAKGTRIALETNSGGAWTELLGTNDATYASGRPGIFACAKDNASCRQHFFTDLVAQALPSGRLALDARVEMLYALAGTEGGMQVIAADEWAGGDPDVEEEPNVMSPYIWDGTDSFVDSTGDAMNQSPSLQSGSILLQNTQDPASPTPYLFSVAARCGQTGRLPLDLSTVTRLEYDLTVTGSGSVLLSSTAQAYLFGVSNSTSAQAASGFALAPSSAITVSLTPDRRSATVAIDLTALPPSALVAQAFLFQGTLIQADPGGVLISQLRFS